MKAKTYYNIDCKAVGGFSKMNSNGNRKIVGDSLGYGTTYNSSKSSTSERTKVIGDSIGYGSTYDSQGSSKSSTLNEPKVVGQSLGYGRSYWWNDNW